MKTTFIEKFSEVVKNGLLLVINLATIVTELAKVVAVAADDAMDSIKAGLTEKKA